MQAFSSSVNSKWFASWPPNIIKAKKGWNFYVETCMMFKTFSSSFKPQFAMPCDITIQTYSDIVLSKVKKNPLNLYAIIATPKEVQRSEWKYIGIFVLIF